MFGSHVLNPMVGRITVASTCHKPCKLIKHCDGSGLCIISRSQPQTIGFRLQGLIINVDILFIKPFSITKLDLELNYKTPLKDEIKSQELNTYPVPGS